MRSVARFHVAASATCGRPRPRSDPKRFCGVPFAGSYGPAQSEVTAVPHWNAPLPSPQYAGYISVPGTSKHIFYHLIVSQRNPAEDPLIVRCITSIHHLLLLAYYCSLNDACHYAADMHTIDDSPLFSACQGGLEAVLLTWKLFLSCIATALLTQTGHR